ncbi:MAG: hypothetical protein B7Z42_04065 [Brevundimonas sp. 12-68-7]|uniref:Recombinase family protein n=1 Tax=Brevundimonas subvibrioides TaxID=74313 RepID=A0A258FHM6_9CAUL|nr:MAG: hypothetical protein B7Z42_04065 [Brevundimonas sp. 12-68-7]OYX32011.1 MAG: hypothetical protein B7Z01_11765 [Brevundimonas subvibrioides]
MSASGVSDPIRAVQYLRMSDSQQHYSLARQTEINAAFATRQGYAIIRTYTDEAVSGVSIRSRHGMMALINDVLASPDFEAIIVADVTRWGRFQDSDEASHYEFICREAGVDVIYSSELFANDGSPAASVLKGVRRAMAAEFSRSLSTRTKAGNRQALLFGGCLGGKAPYGFAKIAVDPAAARAELQAGAVDPARLRRPLRYEWSNAEEVSVVRRIFRQFVREGRSALEIARGLDRNGVKHREATWTSARVGAVLDNTLTAGILTFAKSVNHLGDRIKLPATQWSRVRHLRPMVSLKVFQDAATRRAARVRQNHTDTELINALRCLGDAHGVLSHSLVARRGLVAPSVYTRRFGSLRRAFDLAGETRSTGRRTWRKEDLTWAKVRPALERRLAEEGHLSIRVIDGCDDLPNSNTLRRRFGPLEALYPAVGEMRTRTERLQHAQARRARRVPDAVGVGAPRAANRWVSVKPVTAHPAQQAGPLLIVDCGPAQALSRPAPPPVPIASVPRVLRPAAQYIRMSTRQQKTSIGLQMQAIADYCASHGYEIVRTYIDAGRSGLSTRGRTGLMALLADVVDDPEYSSVIVFDVSRWGRYQDPDEAAHYEFLCRSSGVAVRYCSEPATSKPTADSAIVTSVQRLLAAEFSRQRSADVRSGQKLRRDSGLWPGGNVPFGFSRASSPPGDDEPRVLAREERKPKGATSVRVVWGPPEEVAAVRRVFELFVDEVQSAVAAAATLNGEDRPTRWGQSWTARRVRSILRNELVIGVLALGRREILLGETSPIRPRDAWSRRTVLPPMIDPGVFSEAQARLDGDGPRRVTDALLLAELRRLLAQHTRLDRSLVESFGRFAVRRYVVRFGSLQAAIRQVGFVRIDRDRQNSEPLDNETVKIRLRRILKETGHLSVALINRRGDIPCAATLRKQFGSMDALYEQIGYPTDRAEQMRRAWASRRARAAGGDGA